MGRSTGACDRVVFSPTRAPAFSETPPEFGCVNFDSRSSSDPARGGGFVTIYEDGQIVCQGVEEELPARFWQRELDLSGSA